MIWITCLVSLNNMLSLIAYGNLIEYFLAADGQSEEEDGANGESRNVVQAKRRVSAKRRNEAGETPLHLAAKRGDVAAVRKYLRQVSKISSSFNFIFIDSFRPL